MKTKFTALCFLILIIFIGCNKVEKETYEFVETNLPGEWEISEIEINDVLWNADYKGVKIKEGDKFYNFGEIWIPAFDIDVIKQNNNSIPVRCQFSTGQLSIDIYLNRIFLSVEPYEYFIWIDGFNFGADNDVANVLYASGLFGRNMKMKFIHENEIEMSLLNRPNRLLLKRK
ncbi:MAG TPA: hypothetical protein PLU49_11630 [Saprospiraceae bacterium]|nr:hypothetical protein [Saprospiraceae bacterium]